ncbi:MAG: hypothetical protein KIS87_00220 [Phycisphaeraceae bacterium]|nr:hypothetical protein [Phycisphaeraceae bacterium]
MARSTANRRSVVNRAPAVRALGTDRAERSPRREIGGVMLTAVFAGIVLMTYAGIGFVVSLLASIGEVAVFALAEQAAQRDGVAAGVPDGPPPREPVPLSH